MPIELKRWHMISNLVDRPNIPKLCWKIRKKDYLAVTFWLVLKKCPDCTSCNSTYLFQIKLWIPVWLYEPVSIELISLSSYANKSHAYIYFVRNSNIREANVNLRSLTRWVALVFTVQIITVTSQFWNWRT